MKLKPLGDKVLIKRSEAEVLPLSPANGGVR